MAQMAREGNEAVRSGNAKRLACSGLAMAVYLAVMRATAGFAFLQNQVRIATALYALAAVYPWLVLPLGLANMLSNLLMGGLGVADIAGGLAAGLATSGACAFMGARFKSALLRALPVAIIPSLMAPAWLALILDMPYLALAASVFAGQAISALAGAALLRIDWSKLVGPC